MNKNFKFISSLAVAGILATTSLTGLVSADSTTKSLGVYRKLVANQVVVPYNVERGQNVTVGTIKAEYSNATNFKTAKGDSVTDETTLMGTGATFTVNGVKHTVIVYGDLDGNGRINSSDALMVDEFFAHMTTLNDLQKEAGDVDKNNGVVNSTDSLAIKEYEAHMRTVVINPVPPAEAEDPATESSYTVKANENGYINATTLNNTKLIVGVKNPVDKEKKLTVKVLDANGKDITTTVKTVSPAAALTAKNEAVTVTPKMTEVESVALDFSGVTLKDNKGLVTIQLIETVNKKDTVVGEATVEIDTNLPAATNIRTRRTGEYTATMSFEKLGESDITKMYYKVVEDTTPTTPVTAPTIDPEDEDDKDLKVTSITGNKLDNFEVANDLQSGKKYQIYYVLENSYGSRSARTSADIVNDQNTTIEKAVDKITVPTLEDATAEFSWTLQKGETATGKDFVATLCKDGVPVDTQTVSADTKYDFASAITSNGAGSYTVKVYVKGGATSQDSDVKESEAVKVEELKAVTKITFTTKVNGNRVLTWEDANVEDNVKDYSVKLIPYNANGEEDTANIQNLTSDSKEFKLTTIDEDTVYKAEVVANAKANQMKIVNSKESESARFFVMDAPTVVETKDDSITLELANYITINNKKAEYSVKVYEAKDDQSDPLSDAGYNPPTIRNNVTVTDKQIVIDELKPEKGYAFQILASVDGIEGQSYFEVGETNAAMPPIVGVAVVSDSADATGKTIFYDKTVGKEKLVIEGKNYDVSATSKYPTKLKTVANIVDKLQDNDVITLEDQKIKLELKSEQTNSTTLALGKIAKDMKLEIVGNGFGKTITTDADGKPTEVILSGSGAIFTTTGLNAEKVTLTNGVDVKGDITYTVEKGATVTINGVKVTSKTQDVELTATGKQLEITANNVENALEFENLTDNNHTDSTDAVVISFKGDNNTTYAGTIKITSKKGSITVQENNVGVSNVTLDVVVTDTDVDVSGFAQANNNVKVTVSEDAGASKTVTAKAKMKAPKTMTNQLLKIYKNDVEGDEAIKTDFSVTAEKDINDIRAFINSFNIDEVENATIDATEGEYDVTITFNEETSGEIAIEGID